jgi:hypothetical protein
MVKNNSVVIHGKEYSANNLKYVYTENKFSIRKFLIYPITSIIICFILAHGTYFLFQTLYSGMPSGDWLLNLSTLFSQLTIFSLVSFIPCLFFSKIFCVFLKVVGCSKDILLYKTIHRDEARRVSGEINESIKAGTFTLYQ